MTVVLRSILTGRTAAAKTSFKPQFHPARQLAGSPPKVDDQVMVFAGAASNVAGVVRLRFLPLPPEVSRLLLLLSSAGDVIEAHQAVRARLLIPFRPTLCHNGSLSFGRGSTTTSILATGSLGLVGWVGGLRPRARRRGRLGSSGDTPRPAGHQLFLDFRVTDPARSGQNRWVVLWNQRHASDRNNC